MTPPTAQVADDLPQRDPEQLGRELRPVEHRPADADTGVALERTTRSVPGRVPLVIGDDVIDEHARLLAALVG